MIKKEFAAISGDLVLTKMDSRPGCYLLTAEDCQRALVIKNWDHLAQLARLVVSEDERRALNKS